MRREYFIAIQIIMQFRSMSDGIDNGHGGGYNLVNHYLDQNSIYSGQLLVTNQ